MVSNLTIDGLAINGNYGRTNNNGTSQWYITSALLNNGFVVTGTITATGNFANSDNNQIVELNFGYTPTPNAGVLPVSWGEVAARSTTTGNRITWTTLQETNTSHFDVQRSVDGVRFTTIGTVLPPASRTAASATSLTTAPHKPVRFTTACCRWIKTAASRFLP